MIAPDVNPLSVHVRKINRDLQRSVCELELFLDVSYRVSACWRFYKSSSRIFNRVTEKLSNCAALERWKKSFFLLCNIACMIRFLHFEKSEKQN